MAEPDFDLSPHQLSSLKESSGRINLWEGSVRSGKTIASLIRWVMYCVNSHVRGELIVVSRTRGSAARNVFAPLMDPTLFGDWSKQISYTSGADTATIFGRKVWVLGASDVRSENVLRGLTCAGAYVDEATLLREDFFVQLLNRLWEGAKLFATTNPDNPAHWLKVKYLDRLNVLPDWRTWKFVLTDNPALSEERIAAIKRENVGLYFQRNVLGLWVAAEGAIYPMWDPKRMVVPYDTMPDMRRIYGTGIDYGTTNATAALMLGLGDDRKLYLLDEWRHDSRASQITLTDAEISTALKRWMREPHTPLISSLRPEYVVVDPSAASLKAQMHRDEIEGVVNADNDVAYGIRTIASLMGADEFRVSDRCTGFIGEVPGYAWDDKAALQGKDLPIKVADHSLDAGRYIVNTTEALWRDELLSTVANQGF